MAPHLNTRLPRLRPTNQLPHPPRTGRSTPSTQPRRETKIRERRKEMLGGSGSIPQEAPNYNEAYQLLVRTSETLMQGMKNYQLAAKQRQLQQQQSARQTAQQSAAQGGVTDQQQQNQPHNQGVQFNQLMPEIQQKVNEHTFFYPRAMIQGTRQAENWLLEAKARFGLALQRLQVARSKRAEFKRQAQERLTSDNPLTPQEMESFPFKTGAVQQSHHGLANLRGKVHSSAERVSRHDFTAISKTRRSTSRSQ